MPVGAAPTTSSFSTQHLASIYCEKTTASRDEKHLSLGIWCVLYWRLYGNFRWTNPHLYNQQPEHLDQTVRWFINILQKISEVVQLYFHCGFKVSCTYFTNIQFTWNTNSHKGNFPNEILFEDTITFVWFSFTKISLWPSPYGANGQITMTFHNYRSRQVHETLNGVNPAVSLSEICIPQSLDPICGKFDKFLAHGQAHMGQLGKWPWQCTTTGLDIPQNLEWRKSVKRL